MGMIIKELESITLLRLWPVKTEKELDLAGVERVRNNGGKCTEFEAVDPKCDVFGFFGHCFHVVVGIDAWVFDGLAVLDIQCVVFDFEHQIKGKSFWIYYLRRSES